MSIPYVAVATEDPAMVETRAWRLDRTSVSLHRCCRRADRNTTFVDLRADDENRAWRGANQGLRCTTPEECRYQTAMAMVCEHEQVGADAIE